jgi:hypothetical protein
MYSAIGDSWKHNFPNQWPNVPLPPPVGSYNPPPEVSRADFDALRKEVIELKKLLEAAKKFDKSTGQPHCEVEDKVRLIKEIAKLVDVDLGDAVDKE